jgi:alkylation response protein AidB-like acyl-CoA dehydrogenase
MKKEEFTNPIDKDKTAENPGTLPYAHTVGGALIKPTKQGVIRSKALVAMEQQTDMQLAQIKKQIDLLAEQARAIDERKKISEIIYSARMGFHPQIGHTYHLYENQEEAYVLSMIAPEEWGGKGKTFKQFIASVSLLADHTWKIIS